MRYRMRWPGLVTLVGAAAVLLSLSTGGEAAAADRHVTIEDNKAPSPKDAFDPQQGRWQFNPNNVEVKRGERIVFNNPPGRNHPHTVTSLQRQGGPNPPPPKVPGDPPTQTFAIGTAFESGLIEPGNSFAVETGSLAQGHYLYFCRLHPWMSGELTVVE
jgi:plastocyanin